MLEDAAVPAQLLLAVNVSTLSDARPVQVLFVELATEFQLQ